MVKVLCNIPKIMKVTCEWPVCETSAQVERQTCLATEAPLVLRGSGRVSQILRLHRNQWGLGGGDEF